MQETMKPRRHVLLTAFLVGTVVFVWACFYIPEAQFHWSVQVGEREYGLCHIKAMLYFSAGDRRLYIPYQIAAGAVALAFSLPALVLTFVVTRLWSKTHNYEPRTA